MELIKLVVIVFIIVLTIWIKKPFYLAMIFSIVATFILYNFDIKGCMHAIINGSFNYETIQLLVVLYSITFLQRMLEKRGNLKKARDALDLMFNNRRINSSVAPAIIGLLPAVGAVILCGDIVKDTTDGYMSKEEQACISSYYRHIPELFLPTYTSTIIAIGLTAGKVKMSEFVIFMIPMMLTLFFLGWLFYLRKIPRKSIDTLSERKNTWIILIRNIWPILTIVMLIIVFNIPIILAILSCIVLNIFIEKFSKNEILPMFSTSFESKIIITTVLIMIFKDALNSTGVINIIVDYLYMLPIPSFLIFALIFFIGTMISGSQAIIVLCMSLAISSTAKNTTSLFILLMCMSYAAMQLSPVHICLNVCADYFKIPFGALVNKMFPLIVSFVGISFIYYFLLTFLGI